MRAIIWLFYNNNYVERAAAANVKVLPEEEVATSAAHEQGFLASLRNFFMPEEDRYGFAEGMRRGDYMVAVDADEQHAHQVMDGLEQSGAIDGYRHGRRGRALAQGSLERL